MEKKYEDDELEQLINEQFIREAEIMKEALFSGDEDTEDYEASNEEIKASYQKLMQRLKTEFDVKSAVEIGAEAVGKSEKKTGVKSAAGSEVKECVSSVYDGVRTGNTVVPMKKKRFHARKVAKVAGIIVVSGMCVSAAGMSGEANRNNFVNNVKYLVGDKTKTVLYDDNKNIDINVNETSVATMIKKIRFLS